MSRFFVNLYMADRLQTTPERSKIMKAIKGKDTKPEIALRKILWKKGYRYRKNDKSIKGCPDIVFKGLRLAVFVDSEFFHGFNWEQKKLKIKSNKEYWIKKIERNIERDDEVNQFLTSKGWRVLRFWSFEIKSNLLHCCKIVENEIGEIKSIIHYKQ